MFRGLSQRRHVRGTRMEALESRALFSAASADFVILVSVDGLRPDAVTTLGPTAAPNFYRLRTEGAFTDNARTDHDYTITLPNHTTQITGRPVVGAIGHNWTTNTDPLAGQTLHSNKGSYVASAWDVAHDRGLRTALYASKTKFSVYDTSYDGDATDLQGGAPDSYLADGDQTRDKIDTYSYRSDTAAMTDAFVAQMRSADPFDFAMVHYHDPDSAGHASGWMGTAYMDAVRRVDQQLGKILAAVDATPNLKDRTAVIVTADHGGEGTDHGTSSDPDMYTIPFYVWGTGVSAGADLYGLNGATRANPGTGRLDNAARPQPIRNGDAANLAMDFLDLPPVPGSLFNSGLDLSVAPAPPPAAANDTYSASEDAPLSVVAPGVLANDADPDGDALSAVLVSGPANGTLVFNADGSFTYTPGANFHGVDSFTYRAAGGGAQSNDATVTLEVAAAPDAPVARDDAFEVNEDAVVQVAAPGVLSNDSDPDGESDLSAELLDGPSHGTFTLNPDGSFVYEPDPDYWGPDGFTYRASDGQNRSAPARVELTVLPVNDDAPVARDDEAAADEDTPVVIPVVANDTDGDGDGLVPVIETGPASGGVTVNADGTVTYRPAPNFSGTGTFTYRASDGAASSEVATVTVRVAAVNDAPTVVGDSLRGTEDSSISIDPATLLSNDLDIEGDALTFIQFGTASHGTLVRDEGSGLYVYTPAPNFFGDDTFTYAVADAAGATSTGTVTVAVEGTNDPLTVSDDTASAVEDASVTIGVLGNDSDPDGDAPSVVSVSQPANGTVVVNADGTVTYTPAPDFSGTDTFTYVASDGTVQSSPATVTVTVAPVNDQPVAAGDSYAVDEDSTLTAAAPGVLANDTDEEGQPLTAVLVTGTSHGTLTLNPDGSFTYVPAANYEGVDQFTYRASDGAALSAPATVTVTVRPMPEPPAAPASLKASNVTATSVSLTWQDRSTDETGFVIEYSADNGRTWSRMSVGANTRAYTVTGLTRNTTYRFRVFAFNAAGNSANSNTATATTRK